MLVMTKRQLTEEREMRTMARGTARPLLAVRLLTVALGFGALATPTIAAQAKKAQVLPRQPAGMAVLGASFVVLSDNGTRLATSHATTPVKAAALQSRERQAPSLSPARPLLSSAAIPAPVFPGKATNSTTSHSATARIASRHKPKPKHHVKHKRKGHKAPARRPARSYTYAFNFPAGDTEQPSMAGGDYVMTTNAEPANAITSNLFGNNYPLVTVIDRPGKTIFRMSNPPGEQDNAQFVHNFYDFAAPNGDPNCGVYAHATYKTSTPMRSAAQLTSQPAYSVTGTVVNGMSNSLCGSG